MYLPAQHFAALKLRRYTNDKDTEASIYFAA
jgi:hypothetical protein